MSFKSLFFTSIIYLSFLIHSLCTTTPQLSSNSTLPCQITDNVCQIISLVQNFTSINLINSTLTVNIQDSILTCQDFTSSSCQFLINTSAITLTNTTIYFPDIHLESSTISFIGSNILSNGTQIGGSGSSPTANVGVAYAGQGSSCDGTSVDFSYGDYNLPYTADTTFGSGSTLDTVNSKGGGRIVIISYQDLTMTNTSINASGFGNCTNKQIAVNGGSGGYVWLEHKALATAKEQITSSTIDISGGFGCQGVSEPDPEPIEKRALGNKKTVQIGLGGSGGRAIIYLQKIDSINVITSGGIGKNAKAESCVNGAAGTLYSLKDDILIVKNSNITTSAPTMLASVVVSISTLKVLESGLVSFKKADQIYFSAGGVTLTKGNIVYSNPSSSSVLFKIIDIQLIQQSQIGISGGGDFNLLACHFLVDTSSLIISPNALLALYDQQQCNTPTFVISGDIVSNVTTFSGRGNPQDDTTGIATTLIIYFPVSAANFQLEGGIHYDNAYLFANGNGTFALNSLRISSEYRTCLQEIAPPLINPLLFDQNLTKNTTLNLTQFINSYTGDPSFTPKNLRFVVNNVIRPVYTVFFFIEDNLQFESTVITAARVGIFSKTLSLDPKSTVSTTGKGCSAGLGNGLTNSDIAGFCPGSGGSYGGLGGPGISELNNSNFQFICNSLVGNTYRQEGLPTLEGSGGGGSSDQYLGGKGGGLVVIGMKQGTIDGTIDCNGYIGTIPDDSKTGSGSGGSIQIHTLRRLGGKGTVRAEGGPQTGLGGGFGGGGRIFVNYIGWKEMMSDTVNLDGGSSLTFSAKCGDSAGGIPTLVHHGSVSFRPCLPGFYGPTCLPCQKGTYKADFGNSECLVCENIEGYSHFNKTGETDYLCDFECEDGLVARSLNPHCLSNFSYYAQYVGGIYGVLGLSTLFLVLIVFILKKIVFQEKTLKKIVRNASNKHLNIARMTSRELTISPKAPARMKRASFHSYEPWRVLSQEENFLIEDLPYLKHRLYLKGSNTPYNPWYLSEEPPREIYKIIDREVYSQFCKDINHMCVYSTKWVLLLDLLLVVYAPFYLTLLRFLQKRVVGKVRKFLKEADYNFWSVNKCRIFPFCMKLSTSQNFMLGSVEVLDYKRDFDEWDARDLFPVSLALGGRASFYHPLQINLSDPLVSGLQLNFHEVFSVGDYQQDHLEINLDREEESLEKESIKFLLEFNKLTRQVDFGAFKEWFVKQMIKVIQYIDKKNKTLFKQLDIQVLLFVELSARPGHNLPLKLRSLEALESKPQGSLLDRSKSIIYHLSQESLDFSVEDLRKIHHIYHHDSSISMQFYLKFQYIHHENRINLLQLTKKKTQPVHNRPHIESVFNEIEVDVGQLKEHLFERLEKQGEHPNTVDSLKDVNDEASEVFARDKEVVLCPKGCGSQGKRVLKMLRYLILGYRQWIIQKYILIVVLLLLVVIDLILMILMMIHDIPIVLLNIPFPLVAFAMPITGIFWILGSSSISMGKALLTMNVMAFVNIVQAIVRSTGPNVLALMTLLLIKILIIPFGCQYVSYLNNIRDTVD